MSRESQVSANRYYTLVSRKAEWKSGSTHPLLRMGAVMSCVRARLLTSAGRGSDTGRRKNRNPDHTRSMDSHTHSRGTGNTRSSEPVADSQDRNHQDRN